MKDRRKKIFLMSFISFLIISGIVYVFLIFSAVEDIKKRSFFVSNYSGTQRALLPFFKYLGMIENESLSSLAKSLIPDDFEKVNDIFSSGNLTASSDLQNTNGITDHNSGDLSKSNNSSSNYSYQDKTSFKPSSKLEGGLSGVSSISGGGSSNTSHSLSSLSGSYQSSRLKNVGVDKTHFLNNQIKNSQSENSLIARLNYTKTSLGSALKSKSADGARLEWERGFSGSVKPQGSMFYKDSALELDKFKAGVADLKTENSKGLHTPDVSSPKIESNLSGDKAKEILNNLTQDIAKSMINSLGNAFASSGVSPTGREEEKEESIIADEPAANKLNKIDEEKIKQEVEKWKFEPGENVTTTYFSCSAVNCEKLGINGDGFYKAYFPDGFVLTLNSSGKVVDYYYCVSPVNEPAFLENYQKIVLGK